MIVPYQNEWIPVIHEKYRTIQLCFSMLKSGDIKWNQSEATIRCDARIEVRFRSGFQPNCYWNLKYVVLTK